MMLGNAIVLLFHFLPVFSYSQDVNFVMDRHPDNYFCGDLKCFADVTHSDHEIVSLVAMTIYDITRVNVELKLTSVSTFHPDPYVDNTKSSVMSCTGIISRHQANLTVQLRNDIDCLYGVYKCQLDLVTVSGHSEMLTEIVTPEHNHNYSRTGDIISQLYRLTELLASHTTQVNNQAAQINRVTSQLDNQTSQMNRVTSQLDNQTAQINRVTSQLDNQTAQINRVTSQLDNQTAQINRVTSQLDGQTTILMDHTAQFNNLSLRLDLERTEQKQRPDVIEEKLKKLELNNDTIQTTHQTTDIFQDQRSCIKRNTTKRFLLWENTPALCDTGTDNGGWIIIQRRKNGDVGFYRGWEQYKHGFGNLDTGLWIGNDVIHNLTSQGYNELRVDLIYLGKPYYAHYSSFSVANESMNYQLYISGYSGTAEDSFNYHNNMYFSTFDRDNDRNADNCAITYTAAWWYDSCHYSNLNGQWGGRVLNGVNWRTITGQYSASFSEMKLRRG